MGTYIHKEYNYTAQLIVSNRFLRIGLNEYRYSFDRSLIYYIK